MQATLTRMILPDHTCPFGVRAKEMLEAAGYSVDDRILSTRERSTRSRSSTTSPPPR